MATNTKAVKGAGFREDTSSRHLGDRPSADMLTLSHRLWYVVEWEEDLVGLYAHLLCLVGGRNGASQLALTERLAGLF